jgi:hypothetical protein
MSTFKSIKYRPETFKVMISLYLLGTKKKLCSEIVGKNMSIHMIISNYYALGLHYKRKRQILYHLHNKHIVD